MGLVPVRLALLLLALLFARPAFAQRVHVPARSTQDVQILELPSQPAGSSYASTSLDGGLTDSSSTVDLPPTPRGAEFATITLQHRARFFFGTETGFVVYEGSGWCEYQVASAITQGISMQSGGVRVGDSSRSRASFAGAGQCMPFDGVYDWSGASGWSSGYIWRPSTLTAVVSVAQLGPTLTVTTSARSNWSMNIACHLTSAPSDMIGLLTLMNESWWDGEVDVAFR